MRKTLLAALVVGAACWPEAWRAEAQVPTPEASEFNIRMERDGQLVVGAAEALQGAGGTRVGFYAQCDRSSGQLKVGFSFGAFPPGKVVQGAVRGADGTVERFGDPVIGGRASGFHSPEVLDRKRALRLLDVAFSSGALISNGHNSIWNRIPDGENRAALEELRECSRANGH